MEINPKRNSCLKYGENTEINEILTSNDRFWPLRSSAVGASAGAASVFTSSDIFISFFRDRV